MWLNKSQIYLNCDRICLVTAWMLCSFQAPPTPLEIVQWEIELPPALPLRQVSWTCLLFFKHFLYFEKNHFSSALLVTGVDFPRNSISNWFLLSPLSLSTLLRPSAERWISSFSSSSSSPSLSSSSLSSSVERWISSFSSSSSSSSLSWCAE